MKKVLAIVLSVAMLACFAIPAFAADGVTFSVTAPEYAKAGETISVTVALAEGDFSSANFVLEYDQESLTPKTVISKGGLGNLADAGTGNAKAEEGALFALAFAFPTSEIKSEAPDMNLFTVKFDVNEGVADDTKLEFVLKVDGDVQLADADGVNQAITATCGTATTTVGEAPVVSSEEPSKIEDPSKTDSVASVTSTASTTTSTSNPKTGDAGVAVFAAIVAAAAAAAFVAGKKNA